MTQKYDVKVSQYTDPGHYIITQFRSMPRKLILFHIKRMKKKDKIKIEKL